MSTRNQTLKPDQRSWSPLQVVLCSAAVAALLDAIAGIIFFYTLFKLTLGQFLQFIASAIDGPSAFAAGSSAIFKGFVIHLIISLILAVVYYYAFRASSLLRKNAIVSGIIYGLGIWLVMNLLVFPLSNVQKSPFDPFAASISLIWHIVLVGLPIALITQSHLKNSFQN